MIVALATVVAAAALVRPPFSLCASIRVPVCMYRPVCLCVCVSVCL
eukprot:COSAG02_NODE_8304_length_2623_cov_56.959984_1_plen_45_part_10